MKGGLAKWTIRTVKVLILTAFLWYLYTRVDFPKMSGYLKNLDYRYFTAGILLFAAGMFLNLYKWKTMLSAYYHPSWKDVCASMFGGYALSIFTPARLGEMGRCMFISELGKRKTMSLVGIDKAFNVSITTFLGVFFIQFMPLRYTATVKVIVYFFSALILTFIVMYTRYPKRLYGLLIRIPFLKKGGRRDLLFAIKNSKRDDNIKLFTISLAMYLMYLSEFVLFSMSFLPSSHHVALNAYIISLFLKTALPLTVADWGIKEISMIEFYNYFGLSIEIALGAAMFLYFFNIALPALAGGFYMIKMKGLKYHER